MRLDPREPYLLLDDGDLADLAALLEDARAPRAVRGACRFAMDRDHAITILGYLRPAGEALTEEDYAYYGGRGLLSIVRDLQWLASYQDAP